MSGEQPRKVLEKTLDVFIVAGESSADDLGARFMRSVAALRPLDTFSTSTIVAGSSPNFAPIRSASATATKPAAAA